jgi:SAM-dependent methyltransferase
MKIDRCRACASPSLELVLALGDHPLANALPTAADTEEARYPLDLVLCTTCSLLQITETVPPEILFREYLYFSSFSDTMLGHARNVVERLSAEEKLGPDSLAMEVASNDGYLLQYYKANGIPVLGIEPAVNVAKVAVETRGIPTLTEFFGRELGEKLRAEGKRASVLHANNVMAHVADLPGFVAGIAAVLREGGVAVIEAPYIEELLERCEFDTIYHEHLCYFSLTAVDALVRHHGLVVRHVERLPIHGGSLRYFLAPAAGAAPSPAVQELLAAERAWGVKDLARYRRFAAKVSELRASVRAFLQQEKRAGKRIAAYGAAAKGSTLLNTFGIGTDLLDFVVDRSTYKQGRFMPGIGLPISAPERLLTEQPDLCLLLTWNFEKEILEQQAEYRARGGRFVVPLPTVHVV